MNPAKVQSSTLAWALVWLLNGLVVDGQELRFQRRMPEVNDVAKQIIQCDLEAERIIRQQNQVIDNSKQQLRRQQERTLTILAMSGARPTGARIDYGPSTTRMNTASERAVQVTHPVANNSYFATLHGDELVLRDAQGNRPTPEEEELLRVHLQTFGKPNPLAKFLDGKRIPVGQSLVVPDDVARELLGLTGNTGETNKLTMELIAVQQVDGFDCGIFETLLRTNNPDSSMSLLMRGKLMIEAATCRTTSIALHGPVAISETRGPPHGQFVVSTNGTLQVVVNALYGSNPRVGDARSELKSR